MLGSVIHRAAGQGLVQAGDRVVVVQRLGDTAVVKIVTYDGSDTLPQVGSHAEFPQHGGGGSLHNLHHAYSGAAPMNGGVRRISGLAPSSGVASTASMASVQEEAARQMGGLYFPSEEEGSWSGEGE
jgi:hypothetical protein